MKVEGSEWRHVPNGFGKHSEGHHNLQVILDEAFLDVLANCRGKTRVVSGYRHALDLKVSGQFLGALSGEGVHDARVVFLGFKKLG